MTALLEGVQIVCLIYPLAAALNPGFGLGSAMIPWWLWGITIALAHMGNRCFLRRARSMLGLILFNIFLGLLGGALPVVVLQMLTAARWWPGACPGIVEIALLWPLCVYLLMEPLSSRDRVRFLEIGLGIMTLLVMAQQHFSLEIPFFWLGAGGFVFMGLLREALAHSEGFPSRLNFSRWSAGFPLLLSGFFMAAGLFLGWLVATDRFTHLLDKVIQACVQLLGLIARFFQITGLDRTVEPTKSLPKISGSGSAGAYSAFGDSAPLWFMIILWTILGILLILILIQAVVGLRRILRVLLDLKQSLPHDQKEGVTFRFHGKRLKEQLARILKWFFHRVKELVREWLPLPPRGVKDLYYFFLRWGRRNGVRRAVGETPQEYLDRLCPLLKKKYPQMADSLADLTAVFYLERYKEAGQPFSQEKINFVLRSLKVVKLDQGKKMN
ncbi:DUF4129 domain-containing protein [Candidatus Formimonas warabiya]|uniref:Protein-glutamine gamma-glutamyltransferase-like C-terminal domain-containing protein n=1 Tax=Formimonas warabiya TaxID=1761012 RepID=A0A3G1KXQ5_FORW1|nr:DUF4129 domain-containing protein [Candidatus Formimonas warabiya]ATW27200.1 hypothetical protein DCMF_22785 [Candidatus Formimonas warabiya]